MHCRCVYVTDGRNALPKCLQRQGHFRDTRMAATRPTELDQGFALVASSKQAESVGDLQRAVAELQQATGIFTRAAEHTKDVRSKRLLESKSREFQLHLQQLRMQAAVQKRLAKQQLQEIEKRLDQLKHAPAAAPSAAGAGDGSVDVRALESRLRTLTGPKQPSPSELELQARFERMMGGGSAPGSGGSQPQQASEAPSKATATDTAASSMLDAAAPHAAAAATTAEPHALGDPLDTAAGAALGDEAESLLQQATAALKADHAAAGAIAHGAAPTDGRAVGRFVTPQYDDNGAVNAVIAQAVDAVRLGLVDSDEETRRKNEGAAEAAAEERRKSRRRGRRRRGFISSIFGGRRRKDEDSASTDDSATTSDEDSDARS